MKINAIIVDDEVPARTELKRFLQAETDFEVVGEASDGQEALDAFRSLKPDVLFLDIHIPKVNGLEVASALAELEAPPFILFVTAYDQYAIRAFEVNALDYILKPYDRARFKKACDKVRAAMRNHVLIKQRLDSLRNYLERRMPLKILAHKRNSRDRIFIHPRDVLYFHIKLTEVTAHLVSGDELLVNTTLKSLMDQLDSVDFQQIHRAYIVNLNHVEKVTPLFSGNFKLVLKDAHHTLIPLSRRYAQKLKRLLKW